MRNRIRAALAAAVMISAAVLFATPATAAAEASNKDLAAAVAAVLAENPGGREITPGVISWGDGAVVLTLEGAPIPKAAVGTCASGQYCAWRSTSYTGTKLAFTSCSASGSTSSLALLGGLARSTANARSSGTVQAVNGSTVVYSMSAGTGKASNSTALTALVCYT
ncbi:hypothetical protein [Microbacterium aurum]